MSHINALQVLVIGGMNMDILGRSASAFRPRDSLIGQVETLPGGVGRNIAARLRRLGAAVELLTVLGNDTYSEQLRQSCANLGIDLNYSLAADCPSPLYMAIHDKGGEMRAAINDMRALDLLSPSYIRQILADRATTFGACVLDANLGEPCLLAAAQSVKAPLVADAVSTAKCTRLLPILPYLTAIKPNLMEAQALSGEGDPRLAAQGLLLMGVKQVYISMGPDGLYFADAFESGLLPAKRIPGARVTGAGDAMAAGIAFGVSKGLPALETARFGQRTAEQFLLENPGTETKKQGV